MAGSSDCLASGGHAVNASLRSSLDRTLLLMRDELRQDVSDATLLDALTSTEIVLVADAQNLSSHAAQCAFVTAALLMTRSGHRVYIDAPNVPLIGRQPPLKDGALVNSLLEVGRDLLPGMEFSAAAPTDSAHLCVAFGDSRPSARARHTIAINASP